MRSGDTSSADTRSYNDVPSDQSSHEPRSRVNDPSLKTSAQDSAPRSVRRVAATPKSRSRHLVETIEKSPAVPAPSSSETSSRFQSSSQLATDSHDSPPEDNSTSQTTSSSQSDSMPSRISISLPKPSLPLKYKKKSRSQAPQPEVQPPAQKVEEPPTPASSPRNPHRKGPPIRGRPLIFAAMAANPQAAEIEELPSEEPMLEEFQDESSQQLQPPIDQTPPSQPYPSPKSPTIELKPSKSRKGGPPAQGEPEQPRRRRKLSKATKPNFRNEGSSSHSHAAEGVSASSQQGQGQNLTAGHRHHGDRPLTPVNGSQAHGILGSPIQLQESLKSEKMGHHRRTKSDDHAKLLKRTRDAVKTLTEKQMQKLNRKNSQQEVHTLVQGLPFPHATPGQSTTPATQNQQQLPTPPSHSPDISVRDPAEPTHLQSPPTPPISEEFVYTRSRRQTYPLDRTPSQVSDRLRSDHYDEELQAPPPPPKYYPIAKHVEEPALLASTLCYLSYFEWCTLAVVSREIREVMYTKRELVELVLERYLRTVGYDRWCWKHHDPLMLTLDVRNSFHDFRIRAFAY